MPLGVNCRRPDDAVLDGTGHWKRPLQKFHPDTGQPIQVMQHVCEDCWEPMPNYVDTHSGWVSPESTTIIRQGAVPAVVGVEKCVCYDCWRQAFARVNPTTIPTPEWDHPVRR